VDEACSGDFPDCDECAVDTEHGTQAAQSWLTSSKEVGRDAHQRGQRHRHPTLATAEPAQRAGRIDARPQPPGNFLDSLAALPSSLELDDRGLDVA
jgi:hypothetical protein